MNKVNKFRVKQNTKRKTNRTTDCRNRYANTSVTNIIKNKIIMFRYLKT